MSVSFAFELDGEAVEVVADPKESVLDVMRERLGVYVAKGGCSPQGLCGCCTVLVDGKPRLTCTLPVKSLAGKSVTTLRGVDPAVRDLVAESFADHGAAQCGYCTPGIVLSTCTMLAEKASPSDDDLHRALAPHTCRCTGYTAILAAMRTAAGRRAGDARVPGPVVPEGVALATGERAFVEDLVRPGTWHGVAVFAPVPRGVVSRVDASAVEPGVVVVPLLPPGSAVAHVGDAVLLLAAPNLAMARSAAALLQVEVAPHPAAPPQPLARARRRDGDVEQALGSCAHRAEVEISLAATDAVPLEPEVALAVPCDAGIVVYSPGHDAEAVRAAVTTAIASEGIAARVILVPSGGSYGAKAHPLVEPWAAKLALAVGAPVRLALDHLDATRARPRRPGAVVRGVAGTDAAGRWVALRLDVRFDGGALAHGADRVVAGALGALAYDVPHVDIVVVVEGSGSSSTGPVRGAGAYPVTVATEALVEQLAVAAGQDPGAFRLAHALPGARPVLEAVLRPPGGGGARGLALSRCEGEGGAVVVVTLGTDGRAEVGCSVPELGQGRDAALVAALASSSGLPAEAFWMPWPECPGEGNGAVGATGGPVTGAALSAGDAVRAAGGRPGRYRSSPAGAAPAFVAHRVDLDVDGGLGTVFAAASGGDAPAPLSRGLLEGTTAMGVGLALSEGIVEHDGLPECRFRHLGTLKSKLSPAINAEVLDGPPVDLADSVPGAAAALLVAVSRHEGSTRSALPMKDSAAARSVGVRPPRT